MIPSVIEMGVVLQLPCTQKFDCPSFPQPTLNEIAWWGTVFLFGKWGQWKIRAILWTCSRGWYFRNFFDDRARDSKGSVNVERSYSIWSYREKASSVMMPFFRRDFNMTSLEKIYETWLLVVLLTSTCSSPFMVFMEAIIKGVLLEVNSNSDILWN